ncbi:MAG TPA: transglycosylase SLT domain-containing protein [Candidatus Absconditabacterales bacterium]|nr:transglycosylase SLT domain-containing protein [Candidatus Absconditabacterales bacterium]
MSRKQEVAKEYIDHISTEGNVFEEGSIGEITKQIESAKNQIRGLKDEIDSSISSISGKEKISPDKEEEIKKTKLDTTQKLIDFIANDKGLLKQITGGLILDINFMGFTSDFVKKIKNAQELINQEGITEEDAREKLGLDTIVSSQNTTTESENIENNGNLGYFSISALSLLENQEMEELRKASEAPNSINYLENTTYLKYLNNIEAELGLPKDTLQSVCLAESAGYLYKGGSLIGSSAGAQGLFQFMPGTADSYMKHNLLKDKYGKRFRNREKFLKDPLATARSSGIMLSDNMSKYGFDLPSSLAGYNRGPGNIQKIGGKIDGSNFNKLPTETQNYVKKICNNILKLNGKTQTEEINSLLLDINNLPTLQKNKILKGPEIVAKRRNEFGGIGNSIMTGFQGYYEKTSFKNMNGVEGKTTRTHPDIKKYIDQGVSYKDSVEKYIEENVKQQKVKSFILYFGANTQDVAQTFSDLKTWCEVLEQKGIQPVLCTCIGSQNHPHLIELNKKILELQNKYSVLDFASREDLIAMGSNEHPTGKGYQVMENLIMEEASFA